MFKQAILVCGSYGFVGSLGGATMDIQAEFTNIWHLTHDGTPSGFRAAWLAAKAEAVKGLLDLWLPRLDSRLEILVPEGPEEKPILRIKGEPFNHIPGGMLFLSVVQDFGRQPV